MKQSKFLTLNFKDILKGIIVAIFSAVITYLYTVIQTGDPLTIETFKKVGMVALAALLGYLSKNFFTNSSNKPLTKENYAIK